MDFESSPYDCLSQIVDALVLIRVIREIRGKKIERKLTTDYTDITDEKFRNSLIFVLSACVVRTSRRAQRVDCRGIVLD